MKHGQECQPCRTIFGQETPAEGELVLVNESNGKVARVFCCKRCAMELARAIERDSGKIEVVNIDSKQRERVKNEIRDVITDLAKAIEDADRESNRRAAKPGPTFAVDAQSDVEAVTRLLGDQTYNGEGC